MSQDEDTGELSPEQLAQMRLAEWRKIKAEIKPLTLREKTLRNDVIDSFYPNPVDSGVMNLRVGNGLLKCTFGMEYKFKDPRTEVKQLQNVNEAVDLMLDEIENMEDGKILAERLVKWTPVISVSEYLKLPAKMKEIVDRHLVIKDKAPSLKWVSPDEPEEKDE